MNFMKRQYLLIFLAVLFIFTIRIYKLESLPGEWFGDISNVHEYVQQILKGEGPFYFFQSPGPLYHYLIAPIAIILNRYGYDTYKIASVLVSILGLYATYFFAKEITSRTLALITVLIMSFSSWYLIWSRLGNSQIVIPAISALMSYYLVRYIKRGKLIDLSLGALIASFGWYTYPQTFIFLPIFIFIIFVSLLIRRDWRRGIIHLVFLIILSFLFALPFISIVQHQQGDFTKGYIGNKVIPVFLQSPQQVISKFFTNYKKTLLMLHVRGDEIFIGNISHKPHLDRLSGLLFFAGILYFIDKKKWIWLFFNLFMIGVMILPSTSPAIPNGEIPSSSRNVAIIPYVYLLVSGGLCWFGNLLRKILRKDHVYRIFLSVFSVFIVFINLKSYFYDYAYGLPDHNQAWGKEIAQYIDTLPPYINIYFGSCCWGAWGHPEPKAVAYVLRKQRDFIEYSHFLDSCKEVTRFPALVIFGPNHEDRIKKYFSCFPDIKIENVKGKDGSILFKKISIDRIN